MGKVLDFYSLLKGPSEYVVLLFLGNILIQDTSCRQVMYLKSKITKLGAPEAFRTMQSVPCQRLMGGGGGGYR